MKLRDEQKEALDIVLSTDDWNALVNHVEFLIDAGVAEERERCGAICDVGVKWTPALSGASENVSREVSRLLAKAIRREPPGPEPKEGK